MEKLVYTFGNNKAEGDASMKELLGGKGANLAEMSKLKISVPPGFTIITKICSYYNNHNQQFPSELTTQVNQTLKQIEDSLNLKFGDNNNPLLVSIRSGAKASMPGMMDTILNLGLNNDTVEGLATKTNNRRFAFDSYRRFIQMYASVVLNVDHTIFEELLEWKKNLRGVTNDSDLTIADLEELVEEYKEKVEEHAGQEFPQQVNDQLWGAIKAVFSSWMNQRAITYRRLHDISDDLGTAVNVQSMVFGNMGNDCATGVAFTRDPSTGENIFYGEYLLNAQGEGVVAGIRTPRSINIAGKINSGSEEAAMEESMPDIYKELVQIYKKLEQHYGDMQDIEFTVQNNKLWILQTRSGKRSATAAIKIAVDMVKEGLITKDQAIKRIDPMSIDQLLHPTLDPKASCQVIGKGLPASPGVGHGMVVFSADEAERMSAKHKVILARIETSPEDIHGMHAAQGILTNRGGMTSHAAVVARGMGKPRICGASSVIINYDSKTLTVGKVTVKEGEYITINGSSGEIILGEVPTIQPKLSSDFQELMQWADDMRVLKVRANAETPNDVISAKKFGAEGIGLCRTEHMFFEENRIIAVREMIISDNIEKRKLALAKLLPMQKNDFIKIFSIMESLPVNIRLLDPPLHEFLPHTTKDMEELAKITNVSLEVVRHRCNQLVESNPMLGHRGCRLGISYPEIYEMQVQAIFEAMIYIVQNNSYTPFAEIMIPLVATGKELKIIRELIENVAAKITAQYQIKLNYQIGTMIELPRAALRAEEIAEYGEFFSFGTNDLTQTTYGISRDDAGGFLQTYKDNAIFNHDPFVKLDEEGVGELMQLAIERGRKKRANIKLGICGEHGGDPYSIKFYHDIGLDYISCSPYRVPIARLAAARAALE